MYHVDGQDILSQSIIIFFVKKGDERIFWKKVHKFNNVPLNATDHIGRSEYKSKCYHVAEKYPRE